MKKKLAWLLWLPLSAVSPLALAVGLGQATVNSPLQAPLDAAVPLVDAADVTLDDVRVEIADQADFNALGLEWTPLAASVRAELQRLPSGAQLILRSDQAVNEPWLDLLVTITTPEGRRTEALTLLFDPPNYASSAVPATVSSPVASSAPSSTPQAAVPTASAQRDIAYIASGDTLWGVAERIKPADASVQQMMVALVEANPTAFPSGNVDDMRAGQTLSVPSREQLMARTPAQAAQLVQAMRSPSRSASAPEQPAAEISESAAQPEAVAEVTANDAEPEDPQPAEGASTATVQEGELAGLTLNDLAEQLLESQAMLQTVLEEREAMRAEMAALRQEVASLTEALNASQQEAQRALAAAESRAAESSTVANSPSAMNEPMSASSSPGVIERLEQYQWPLASVALALLLGALVWSRKRRERQWEDAPAPAGFAAEVTPPKRSEPSVAATPKTEQATQTAPPEESFYTPPHTETAQESSQSDVTSPLDEEPRAEYSNATRSGTAFSLAEEDAPSDNQEALRDEANGAEMSDDEVLSYAEAPSYEAPDYKVSDDKVLSYEVPSDDMLGDEPSPASDDDEAALEAAFLETPEPVEESASPANEGEEALPKPTKPVQDEDRAHYIDYHPPSLTNETPAEEATQESQSGWSQRQESGAARARRVPEEEWEIEEVAFEPRRRDNSEPSKFSK